MPPHAGSSDARSLCQVVRHLGILQVLGWIQPLDKYYLANYSQRGYLKGVCV